MRNRSPQGSASAVLGFCLWFLAALWACPAALAAPTVLDFEDLAPGTQVTTQYGARGVVFLNHYLGTDPAAHSGTHVLRTVNPASEIFVPIPLAMTFNAPQALVKFFAESQNIPLNGTLTAFNAAGNVVAQDGPKLVAANVFTTPFQVTVSGNPTIVRAELRLENGAYFAIDDLTFDGEAPHLRRRHLASLSPRRPMALFLDTSTLDISGTVKGEGLVSPVTLTMNYARPPESTAPPFTSSLELTGTGTSRNFALPGFTGLPMGPITISVTASNSGGKTGSAVVSITNMPAAILGRFAAEGGSATFGALSFGLVAPWLQNGYL